MIHVQGGLGLGSPMVNGHVQIELQHLRTSSSLKQTVFNSVSCFWTDFFLENAPKRPQDTRLPFGDAFLEKSLGMGSDRLVEDRNLLLELTFAAAAYDEGSWQLRGRHDCVRGKVTTVHRVPPPGIFPRHSRRLNLYCSFHSYLNS